MKILFTFLLFVIAQLRADLAWCILEIEPNNTMGQAQIISVGANIQGSLSSPDDFDYYAIQVASDANLLSVTIIPASIEEYPDNNQTIAYQLQDSSSNVLAGATLYHGDSYSKTVGLSSGGTYYLRIFADEEAYVSGTVSLETYSLSMSYGDFDTNDVVSTKFIAQSSSVEDYCNDGSPGFRAHNLANNSPLNIFVRGFDIKTTSGWSRDEAFSSGILPSGNNTNYFGYCDLSGDPTPYFLGHKLGETISATRIEYENPVSGAAVFSTEIEWFSGEWIYTDITVIAGKGNWDAPPRLLKGEKLDIYLYPSDSYEIGSVGGTCGGTLNLSGETPIYTTEPLVARCSIQISFSDPNQTLYTVTPSAGSGGSISPSSPQTVSDGSAISFTITPSSGYGILNVGGSCGGNLTGNTYTTNAITSDCTVTANFESTTIDFSSSDIKSEKIELSLEESDAICDNQEEIFKGHNILNFSSQSITLTGWEVKTSSGWSEVYSETNQLRAGYQIDRGYCDANENHYLGRVVRETRWSYQHPITNEIIKSDVLTWASAATTYYTVTPSAGIGGSISPSTPQSVEAGATTSFTVASDPGYEVTSVGGTCGGSLRDSTFTTNPINSDCTVKANFSLTASVEETEIHTIIPGTSCTASDPGTSLKLQSRESGLINTKSDDNLEVVCPIVLPLIETIETIDDVRLGISLRAISTNLDLEEGDEMDCSLTEQLGQDIRSMLAVDVPLAFEEETSKTLGESLTVSYLRSYSVTCDLPPQTAITSIETRLVIE